MDYRIYFGCNKSSLPVYSMFGSNFRLKYLSPKKSNNIIQNTIYSLQLHVSCLYSPKNHLISIKKNNNKIEMKTIIQKTTIL